MVHQLRIHLRWDSFVNILSNLSSSLFIFAGNTGGHSYEDIGTQVRATQNEEQGTFYKRNSGII